MKCTFLAKCALLLIVGLFLSCGEDNTPGDSSDDVIHEIVDRRWKVGYERKNIDLYLSAFWPDNFLHTSDNGTPKDAIDDLSITNIKMEEEYTKQVFDRFKNIVIEYSEFEPDFLPDGTAQVRIHYKISCYIEDEDYGYYAEGNNIFTFEQKQNEWRIKEWKDEAYSPENIVRTYQENGQEDITIGGSSDNAIRDVVHGRWKKGLEERRIDLYSSAFWPDNFLHTSDNGTPGDTSDDLRITDIKEEEKYVKQIFDKFDDVVVEYSDFEPDFSPDGTAQVDTQYKINLILQEPIEGGYYGYYAEGNNIFTFERRGNEWRIKKWEDKASSLEDSIYGASLIPLDEDLGGGVSINNGSLNFPYINGKHLIFDFTRSVIEIKDLVSSDGLTDLKFPVQGNKTLEINFRAFGSDNTFHIRVKADDVDVSKNTSEWGMVLPKPINICPQRTIISLGWEGVSRLDEPIELERINPCPEPTHKIPIVQVAHLEKCQQNAFRTTTWGKIDYEPIIGTNLGGGVSIEKNLLKFPYLAHKYMMIDFTIPSITTENLVESSEIWGKVDLRIPVRGEKILAISLKEYVVTGKKPFSIKVTVGGDTILEEERYKQTIELPRLIDICLQKESITSLEWESVSKLDEPIKFIPLCDDVGIPLNAPIVIIRGNPCKATTWGKIITDDVCNLLGSSQETN